LKNFVKRNTLDTYQAKIHFLYYLT